MLVWEITIDKIVEENPRHLSLSHYDCSVDPSYYKIVAQTSDVNIRSGWTFSLRQENIVEFIMSWKEIVKICDVVA